MLCVGGEALKFLFNLFFWRRFIKNYAHTYMDSHIQSALNPMDSTFVTQPTIVQILCIQARDGCACTNMP